MVCALLFGRLTAARVSKAVVRPLFPNTGALPKRTTSDIDLWHFAAIVASASAVCAAHERQPLQASTRKLSPVQIQDITHMVLEQTSIPMVPQSIQEGVVSEAVHVVSDAMASKLSDQQMAKLSDAIDGVSDGVSLQERQHLIDMLVGSLDAVPMIPKSFRENLVTTIVDVMIGDTSVSAIGAQTVAASIMTGTTLFDEEGRKKLTKRLTDRVHIPGMSVAQEAAMFMKGVEMLADVLEHIIPPAYRKSLHGMDKHEIEVFKKNMIHQLEDKLAIPMLPEEFKYKVCACFVDAAFELMLDASGLDQIVLSPEMKLERIDANIAAAAVELESAKRAARRREHTIMRRLQAMEAQRAEVEKEMHGNQHHWMIKGLVVLGASAAGILIFEVVVNLGR